MKDKDKDLRVPIKEQFPDVLDICFLTNAQTRKQNRKNILKRKIKTNETLFIYEGFCLSSILGCRISSI